MKLSINFFSLKVFLILLTLFGTLFSRAKNSVGQIIPDQSLGLESAIVIPFDQFIQLIQSGAIRGENLFQSFQDFNINENQQIFIANPNGVNNILIRVTGNNPSEILGALTLLKSDSINNIINQLPNFGNLSEVNLQNLIGIQDIGTANLFFLNPNGILFGENASINLGGSFLATTANQINFADGSVFSANINQSLPLLTISTPIGLEFTQSQPQSITVKGKFQELTNILQSIDPDIGLGDSENILADIFTNLAQRPDGLTVFPNQTLALVGGDIYLEGGSLTGFASNNIELGSIATEGKVSLNPTNQGWQLDYSQINSANQGTIQLSQLALINPDKFGQGKGEVNINGKTVNIIDESAITSFTFGDEDGGNININAQKINLVNGAIIATGTINPTIIDNEITLTPVYGNSGNIEINSNDLTVKQSAFLGSLTIFSEGKSGNISINADNTVNIIEDGYLRTVNSSILSNGEQIIYTATGNSGEIIINTNKLNILSSGEISNETELGNGGNITISANDSIIINGFFSIIYNDTIGTGNAGNININTQKLIIENQGFISAESERIAEGEGGDIFINATELIDIKGEITGISSASGNLGNAGDIQIITKKLSVADNGRIVNGARSRNSLIEGGNGGKLTIFADNFQIDNALVSSFSLGSGKAGNIQINSNNLTLDNQAIISTDARSLGNAGNIKINNQNQLLVTNNSQISSSTFLNSQGEGGKISINTNSLALENQGQINTLSQGSGNAGNINLNIDNSFTANNGEISANANQTGGGGITINAQNIRLRGDSDIRTNVNSGAGNGGNITITTDSMINFNDSDILAFARDGKGGNIFLNTPIFFGDGYQPSDSVNNPNSLDGNGRVDINATGAVSGAIVIPDLTYIENSLVQLSESLINPENLIANTCVVPNSRQQGTFIIKGSGGLPTSPNKSPISPYPTGTVQTLPDTQPDTNNNQSWRKEDPIVEAQGIFKTADGKLILSRQCP